MKRSISFMPSDILQFPEHDLFFSVSNDAAMIPIRTYAPALVGYTQLRKRFAAVWFSDQGASHSCNTAITSVRILSGIAETEAL